MNFQILKLGGSRTRIWFATGFQMWQSRCCSKGYQWNGEAQQVGQSDGQTKSTVSI